MFGTLSAILARRMASSIAMFVDALCVSNLRSRHAVNFVSKPSNEKMLFCLSNHKPIAGLEHHERSVNQERNVKSHPPKRHSGASARNDAPLTWKNQ